VQFLDLSSGFENSFDGLGQYFGAAPTQFSQWAV